MKLELKDPSSLREVVFQYDSGEIPPPFCFRYRLNVIFGQKQPEVLFNIEYYDRDDLTEDEIYEEGFTPEDNFHWKGKLPAIWKDLFLKKLLQSGWKKTVKQDNFLQKAELKVRLRYTTDDESERLWPEQLQTWEDFLQEVIQAIFEVSKREMPLGVRYLEIDASGEKIEKRLTFEFAYRNVQVKVIKNGQKSRSYSLEWNTGKKIMKDLFFPDYDMEKAGDKKPDRQGRYIDPGMGLWFDLSNAVESPNAKKNSSKIIFNDLNLL